MERTPYFARLLTLGSLATVSKEMTRLEVDKGGVPIMSNKAVHRLILVEQVPVAAANVIKQEMLARGGDLITPRTASGFEAPYVDVVFVGSLMTLRSAISKLYRQHVYDLPRIADAVQAVLMRTTPGYLPVAAKANRQGVVVEETLEDHLGGRMPLEPGTFRATGTPPPMALPGVHWQFDKAALIIAEIDGEARQRAAAQACRASEHGAVGVLLNWTGLAARDLDPAGVVAEIRGALPHLTIAATATGAHVRAALAAGCHLLWGSVADRLLLDAALEAGAAVVLTHDLPIADHDDALTGVARSFNQALENIVKVGGATDQLLLDAGIGMGKTEDQELVLIRRMRELRSFGRPVAYQRHGRPPAAGAQSLPLLAAEVTSAIMSGADVVAIRDVSELYPAVHYANQLARGRVGHEL